MLSEKNGFFQPSSPLGRPTAGDFAPMLRHHSLAGGIRRIPPLSLMASPSPLSGPLLLHGMLALGLVVGQWTTAPAIAGEPVLVTFSIATQTGGSHPGVEGFDAGEPASEGDLPANMPESDATARPVETVTAHGLRVDVDAASAGASVPCDLILVVDTSASQTGVHRTRSLEAVDAVVRTCDENDRILLAAIDVDVQPLTDGFVSPMATGEAVRRLQRRTPLGSTDLVAGITDLSDRLIEQAGKDSVPRRRAILYVGDGPALGEVEPEAFRRLLDRLADRRIAFSAVGVGGRVDWVFLAAVANATGGVMAIPEADESATDSAVRIAAMARGPVFWADDVLFSADELSGHARMLPSRFPPLRADRDTVILVHQSAPPTIGSPPSCRIDLALEAGSEAGDEAREAAATGDASNRCETSVALPQATPVSDNAFLAELFANAADSGGIFLPTLGREGLDYSRKVIRSEADRLAQLGQRAVAVGDRQSAARLAEASLRRDPDNPYAGVVRSAAQAGPFEDEPEVGPDEEIALPGARMPTVAPPGSRGREPVEPLSRVPEPSELDDQAKMRRVREEQFQQEIAVVLRNARVLMATDPQNALNSLKNLKARIDAQDLDAALRDRLKRQVEMRIREADIRVREKAERDLAIQRRKAEGLERKRLADAISQREEQFASLTKRYHALVEEGIRVGYQEDTDAFLLADQGTATERGVGFEMAEVAPNLYANYGMPMPAREVARSAPLVARILDYDAENMRYRRDTQRAFMDVLHLVDLAAIPFPDEPPVVYPSAERWREITRLRERYKSVDLANPGSAEERIYDALDNTVENFTFDETPLQDVIAQIQDSQGIPVQLNLRALDDAGLDPEEPITRDVSGITLRSALRMILRDLDLTYVVKDEVLMITTKDDAEQNMVIKVYPVADLVIPINPQGGVNPFQTGGGLGGQGGVGSGQAGGGMGGGAMGGGMFQVADAEEQLGRTSQERTPSDRLAARPDPDVSPSGRPDSLAGPAATGLPRDVLSAKDLVAALGAYLAIPTPTAATGSAGERGGVDADGAGLVVHRRRLAEVRQSALELGRAAEYGRAAELLSAAISAGHAEGWMYEALAAAAQADGWPAAEVERILLSAADFASSAVEMMPLANLLARTGAERRAIEICRRITRLEPSNREAFALAMTLASKLGATADLEWSCAGVLSHDWPAEQVQIAHRAARLAKATIRELREQGRADEAMAFEEAMDAALVRDLEVEITWNGDADVDLLVEEPIGSVCSHGSTRSPAGGVLLTEPAAGDARPRPMGRGAVAGREGSESHRERYVCSEAFPGRYRVLVRRIWGDVAADTVTAELVLHRGTDREERVRKQLPVGAGDVLLNIDLPVGRRQEPLDEARLAQDVRVQERIGKAILAQQIAGLADPAAVQSLSQSRSGQPVAGGSLPFTPGSAVGYQPVITTLPEGINLAVTPAVITADRRYVRITTAPLFSGVGQVTQFNFSGGGAQGTGGAGGMGGGGMGGGGMGGGGMGGMGGGGMGGGGMGGMQGGQQQRQQPVCWVAREVYGEADPRWLVFRDWLTTDAPPWLLDLYRSHGESFAGWIHDRPAAKAAVRFLMDGVVERELRPRP
jgi:hypothetical protein